MSNLSPEELENLLNGPALAPPPGVVPQFDNPPNHWILSRGAIIACLTITTVAVATSLYTRIRIGVFVGYIACAVLVCKQAPGVHQWNVRLRNFRLFLYYFHVATVLYGVSIFFVKFSILMQYIRIFMPFRKPTRLYWATIFIIAINFIVYFLFTFLAIFSCHPIAKAWDPLITGGHCINLLALGSALGAINTISDIIILIVPQVVIWRMNLSLRNKVEVSLIFTIATFASVCAAVRFAYAVILQSQTDVTYYTWLAGVWTLPEMTAAIVVACVPVIKGFVKSVFEIEFFSRIVLSIKRVTSWSKLSSTRDTSGYELDG
ncbi:hypothetical protein F5Y04DRAFT_285032 [Hypomontagnella monticulosa]|nr:hypothetical protein F5Y04DRAFT_285032 [Hypomontagnella monticulosa]